ncbi:TPA: ead/Ea22-like family protein [Pseudomonas aeruginosa]|uniref:ead/Ea22-like family protein n=1 Tax=Pseudomonas aeruginosa TaxID=287 RepID=UPI0029D6EDA6|nr:ead/Ea22-like family protein [Pseudomonas aeruginosa]HEJ6473648.1 ead/Ea22-like family protein [Pseudomonas aeruginosa]
MTDHAELRRLSEVATPGEWRTGDGDDSLPDCVLSGEFVVCEHAGGDVDYIAAANPKTVLALLDEIDRLKAESDRLRQGMKGDYDIDAWLDWSKEKEQIKAQNDALQGALHAVQAEVDGNLRPLTRDLVNMVSGLNNGCHPNDIYDHCDEIERIIGAALEGAKP